MSLDKLNKLFRVEDDNEAWDGDPDCEACILTMAFGDRPCSKHTNPPEPRHPEDQQ